MMVHTLKLKVKGDGQQSCIHTHITRAIKPVMLLATLIYGNQNARYLELLIKWWGFILAGLLILPSGSKINLRHGRSGM